jgi:hypothetical protein
MNLRPLFYFLGGLLIAVFFFECLTRKPEPVIVEKVVTKTVIDTLRYPEYIEIQKPVTVVKEKKVYITNQRQLDSLIKHFEEELDICSKNYEFVLKSLYEAHVGDTVVDEREMKLYADNVKGENYELDWQIGVYGELHHFHPTVKVNSTEKTITTKKKRYALGVNGGLYVDTDLNLDPGVGLLFDKDWWGIQATVIPNQKAAVVTFNSKIRW